MYKCLTSNSRVADTLFSLGLMGMVSLVQRTRVTAHGEGRQAGKLSLWQDRVCFIDWKQPDLGEPCGQVWRKGSELLIKHEAMLISQTMTPRLVQWLQLESLPGNPTMIHCHSPVQSHLYSARDKHVNWVVRWQSPHVLLLVLVLESNRDNMIPITRVIREARKCCSWQARDSEELKVQLWTWSEDVLTRRAESLGFDLSWRLNAGGDWCPCHKQWDNHSENLLCSVLEVFYGADDASYLRCRERSLVYHFGCYFLLEASS